MVYKWPFPIVIPVIACQHKATEGGKVNTLLAWAINKVCAISTHAKCICMTAKRAHWHNSITVQLMHLQTISLNDCATTDITPHIVDWQFCKDYSARLGIMSLSYILQYDEQLQLVAINYKRRPTTCEIFYTSFSVGEVWHQINSKNN